MWDISIEEAVADAKTLWLDAGGVAHDDLWCAARTEAAAVVMLRFFLEEIERRRAPLCPWCCFRDSRLQVRVAAPA